ncbi:dual specificity protein kinase [Canna indica]|uniref:Dual specificity protein kinase n=1 Tax=Canna indica TaxID=4628 RepID=A0AAQ3Q1Q9_9LILI|nr:dual specificity protein kinase [Canna indica]
MGGICLIPPGMRWYEALVPLGQPTALRPLVSGSYRPVWAILDALTIIRDAGCIVVELFLGSPLFLGASEYDVLKMMTEIHGGQPPDHVLRYGTKTCCFFKQNGSMYQFQTDQNNNCSAYQLLEDVDFELRGLTKPRRRHFFPVKLEDVIHNHYRRKTIPEERSRKDTELLLALMDLLRGLLELDPAKRLTPSQALQHPFVTGHSFVTQYQHFQAIPPIVHLVPLLTYEAECSSFTYFVHRVSRAATG